MARILLAYHTTDGHTLTICQRLQAQLADEGHAVTVQSIAEANNDDLDAFDTVVIGASIRYGHHAPAVFDFIRRHRVHLDSKPNAFFSVNIVARKPEKNTPANNPYLKKFLRRIDWQPRLVDVFAGRLDYPRYGFFDRQMIRLIMWMTKGPTDPGMVVEFTDWTRVAEFGRKVGKL